MRISDFSLPELDAKLRRSALFKAEATGLIILFFGGAALALDFPWIAIRAAEKQNRYLTAIGAINRALLRSFRRVPEKSKMRTKSSNGLDMRGPRK